MTLLTRRDAELAPVLDSIPPEGLSDLHDYRGASALAALPAQLPPPPEYWAFTDQEARARREHQS